MADDTSSSMSKAVAAGYYKVDGPPKPYPRDPVAHPHPETVTDESYDSLYTFNWVVDGVSYTYVRAQLSRSTEGPVFLLDNPELLILAEYVR